MRLPGPGPPEAPQDVRNCSKGRFYTQFRQSWFAAGVFPPIRTGPMAGGQGKAWPSSPFPRPQVECCARAVPGHAPAPPPPTHTHPIPVLTACYSNGTVTDGDGGGGLWAVMPPARTAVQWAAPSDQPHPGWSSDPPHNQVRGVYPPPPHTQSAHDSQRCVCVEHWHIQSSSFRAISRSISELCNSPHSPAFSRPPPPSARLQRDLTLTSVLAAARSLARCAAAPCSQAEAGRVVARAQRLLRHLNEGVDDCTALGADVPDAASFLKDLREIPWLPVLRQPPPAELCVPWNVKALPDAGKPPLMAPVRVRPAAQLHVASYCYGVLDGQATTATQERFGWTQGPGARELAVQLLQLADTHRAAVGAPDAGGTEGAAVEATGNASGTPTAVSRSVGRQFDAIFSALQALHCPAADAEAPSEEAAGAPRADAGWAAAGVMLQAADCVWASEYGRFYALSSLAFGSDIDAAPHLITVRESLTQFSDLLRALGVRALFDIRDYLALLQAWHRRADASGPSRALDATELELAVQIANAVSQSPENAEAAKQTALYLPDAEGRLAAVNELCYNDAEWLMDAQVPPPPLSKLRPCPSYSRRRDRINLVLWRSLDKGGGGTDGCALHT